MYLNEHGVYYRQCMVFVILIETNPHTRNSILIYTIEQ